MLDLIDAERTLRFATKPQPSSVADYRARKKLVDDAIDEADDGGFAERLNVVMGRWSGSRQTFTKMRSAIKHFAVEDVRVSVATLKAVRLDHFGIRPAMVKQLQGELYRLSHIHILNRNVCMDLVSERPRRPKPKSQVLKLLRDGWRENFLNAVKGSEEYAMCCALLNTCGLRPVELEKGVELLMIDDAVQVRINGGKVRAHAGQPWREFILRKEALPSWAYERIQLQGQMAVTANAANLRAYIGRVSKALHPRHEPPRPKDVLLCPYLFRHAIVSDMRAEGWSSADIAKAIGESSAETVAWYGLNWSTGSRRPKEARHVGIVRDTVEAARPVKPAATAGLNQVRGQRERMRKSGRSAPG